MKKILLTLILFSLPTLVYAGPFAYSDCSLPEDNVTGALLQIDGGTFNAISVATTCPTTPVVATEIALKVPPSI